MLFEKSLISPQPNWRAQRDAWIAVQTPLTPSPLPLGERVPKTLSKVGEHQPGPPAEGLEGKGVVSATDLG